MPRTLPRDRVMPVLLFVPHLAVGGAELQLFTLARALPSYGFRPIVASMEERHGAAERLRSAGVDVCILPRSSLGLGSIIELSRLARKEGVRIVHAWLFSANWRAAAARVLSPGVRVLFSVRSLEEDLGSARSLLYRLAARRASTVLTNSEAVRQQSMRRLGLPEARYRVVRNGVDVDRLFLSAGRTIPLSTELTGAPVLGYLGSLSRRKRVDTLPRIAPTVLASVPSARFLIVGDGELRAELTAACRRHGVADRFYFAGRQEEVAPWISRMKVLVHPSGNEGSSNAILEAQALGVPVVAYAVSGNLETVTNHETGLLVPAGDESSLTDAVLTLLRDERMRATMSDRARRMVRQRFSVDAMVEQTVAAYRSVLERDD